MKSSHLYDTVCRVAARSASAMVARSRIASQALNAILLRRLSVEPGEKEALLADPVFEAKRSWRTADRNFGDFAGDLLHADLVDALDRAENNRIRRDCHPFTHQVEAWKAVRSGMSCLISSGTGSGKTECFMLPILSDLLSASAQERLVGIRAIIIYPLNALIESQRERLSDWTNVGDLRDRVTFALYNGLTPETPREVDLGCVSAAELGDRRTIRKTPPALLVTNVTMLEYLLLRAQDRDILRQSQGMLQWIVLDEAHSYVGAQAAEMTLLLRRVRAAFGVSPEQVRLIAASATVSEGKRTRNRLEQFISSLAGVGRDQVCVIEGEAVDLELPAQKADTPLNPESLLDLEPTALWQALAPHPRIQDLMCKMSRRSVTLGEVATILYGAQTNKDRSRAQVVLDAAAQARHSVNASAMLPWKAHVFHRAQGGFWACVDPACGKRGPELEVKGSNWTFGAIWLAKRDRCECGAPVFELYVCSECGSPSLIAGMRFKGHQTFLIPADENEVDDFLVDAEPEEEEVEMEASAIADKVMLLPEYGEIKGFLRVADGMIFDNSPPKDERCVPISWTQERAAPTCCAGARSGIARHTPQRYGPPFLMGASMPILIEALGQSLDRPGLPMGGRRAITFSDSRQGVARLAAKLQRDAERNLTRAFLYHIVQEAPDLEWEEKDKLEKRLKIFRKDPETFSDLIRETEEKLAGGVTPVRWDELVNRFSRHTELKDYAIRVWSERRKGGREMAEDPSLLAKMFLYRELSRRPKVQNNAETMGLLRLSFPTLEERARSKLPSVLSQAGLTADDWVGLALAAIDFVFRASLAIEIPDYWMVRLVSPKRGGLNSISRPGTRDEDRPRNNRLWPSPRPNVSNPSRLHRLVYAMLKSGWEDKRHQDQAGEVLQKLWELISTTAAKDIGGGAYQLDFQKVAVTRLDRGWLCPVTHRIFGYSPSGRSPYDPDQNLSLVKLPRLPSAKAGGLDAESRASMTHWCESSPEVQVLRNQGIWTNLHDRAASYTRFFRAQEHSAQIERAVLSIYENQFREGYINLLNCSTTMEMGVDIPDIQMVANSNVPPSISNYRQRVGRAGRRDEPWAFGITFCRNLPLDQTTFQSPSRFLGFDVVSPSVVLDSRRLVSRHVHAALLAAFFRNSLGGVSVRSSAGYFFGATDPDQPITKENHADQFLDTLQKSIVKPPKLVAGLGQLVRGTVLDGCRLEDLVEETKGEFENLLLQWRREYTALLDRISAAEEKEVQQAFQFRARRMRGEFLLGELARRGFTPSYGFPVDVVAFDHLSGHERRKEMRKDYISFGEHRGAASRTLDVAIREYAPGSEVVVDGLVHRSDGILPAWEARADASGVEDLQTFWECSQCHYFKLTRLDPPNVCSECGSTRISWKRSLRPSGFLGRHEPHTGYENLGHVPYEMPRISVSNDSSWQTFSDSKVGRFRADFEGKVVTFGSGRYGKGYALCLICGRAEAEEEGSPTSMLSSMRAHKPLAKATERRETGGYCPGALKNRQGIQRNVHLTHAVRTDVFELQLPDGTSRGIGLGLASGLREVLTRRLGIEAQEVGVAVGWSLGPDQSRQQISAFLYDQASGGAGISTRLVDAGWLSECWDNLIEQLACPDKCEHGCPACVLRPDLNFGMEKMDRFGALNLAKEMWRSVKFLEGGAGDA